MTRLSNRNAAIIAAVLFAVYTVYSNIVAPLMHEEEFSTERPDMHGFEEDEVVTEEGSNALLAVNTSVLFWDDAPTRDPYVFQTRIDRQSIRNTRRLRGGGKVDGVAQDFPTMAGFIAGVESKLAVVNNTIVTIGQQVGGYTVLDIDPQGVQLEDRKNRTRLKLKLEH